MRAICTFSTHLISFVNTAEIGVKWGGPSLKFDPKVWQRATIFYSILSATIFYSILSLIRGLFVCIPSLEPHLRSNETCWVHRIVSESRPLIPLRQESPHDPCSAPRLSHCLCYTCDEPSRPRVGDERASVTILYSLTEYLWYFFRWYVETRKTSQWRH